eukprot:184271_1
MSDVALFWYTQILLQYVPLVLSHNCTELFGISQVSTSFGDISLSVDINTNCTVKFVFEQPADKGYTGWAFGGDYSLRGRSLMNGYSFMTSTDGTTLEYELKRSRPYFAKHKQQDLDCDILNKNNLLTVTCYRDLYTNDSMDYYDGWTTSGTIDVMWCWDKSGGVSSSNTHTKEGFTQMDMSKGGNSLVYEIIGIVVGVALILFCLWYFICNKCGCGVCIKRNMDKYCWNIFVDAYYGILCCHFCKFQGEVVLDLDNDYTRSTVQGIQFHTGQGAQTVTTVHVR